MTIFLAHFQSHPAQTQAIRAARAAARARLSAAGGNGFS